MLIGDDAFVSPRTPALITLMAVSVIAGNGDAQPFRFPDGSFERRLSLLVLDFIPDPAKALDEMIRVTRPDGTAAAVVWDYGRDMEMLRVFWDEAISLDPAMAGRDERDMPL